MGELVSRIPELFQKSGMTEREFKGLCYAEGIDPKTVERLLAGETNVSARVLAAAARVFDIHDLGDIIIMKNNSAS